MSHAGFFISGFPVLDGVSTRVCFSCYLGALTSRARGVDSCDARGKDVHQAAKEDNVGAVRHFLRVDPDSLERKDIHFGRSLGTEVGSYEADPRLP